MAKAFTNGEKIFQNTQAVLIMAKLMDKADLSLELQSTSDNGRRDSKLNWTLFLGFN